MKSCKVICIKNKNPNDWDFTVGKIYEVSRRGIVDDAGYRFTMFTIDYKNLTPVEAWLCWSEEARLKFKLIEESIRRF